MRTNLSGAVGWVGVPYIATVGTVSGAALHLKPGGGCPVRHEGWSGRLGVHVPLVRSARGGSSGVQRRLQRISAVPPRSHRCDDRSVRRRGWRVTGWSACIVGLAAADGGSAWVADRAAGIPAGRAALDILVGFGFVAAAVVSLPSTQRLLTASVGLAWLLGSWWPPAAPAHRGVLLVALAAFPYGRLKGCAWSWLAVAVVVGGLLPRADAAAVAFAALALTWLSRGGRSRWYPTAGAVAAALVLAAVRWWQLTPDPRIELAVLDTIWQVLLVLIAASFPVAAWSVRRASVHVGDRLIADGPPDGHGQEVTAQLTELLRKALADETLTVKAPSDHPSQDLVGRSLEVVDNGRTVAVIHGRTALLEDARTARSVTDAVALSLAHSDLRRRQRDLFDELAAARERLLASEDDVRRALSVAVRNEVDAPLGAASAAIAAVCARDHQGTELAPLASAALVTANQELDAVRAEMAALATGVPAVHMGSGQIRDEVLRLAARSPIPADVSVLDDAGPMAADKDPGGFSCGVVAETTLFYVCSEALANAVKHSGASRIRVVLRRLDDRVQLSVSDDGRGGADPSGHGLTGLAERVAATAGQLQVDSNPGAGTRVLVVVPVPGRDPVSRSSATA
jgi:signal transduction histidine kinase